MHVPQIKSLTIQTIIKFAAHHFDLDNYLLKYKKWRMPDRGWIWNLSKINMSYRVVYSKLKETFSEWIQNKMKEREKMIVMKKNFQVKVLPEFSDAILKSNRVSCNLDHNFVSIVINGRSHLLIRLSVKRRKLEEETKEVVAFHHDLEEENRDLICQVDNLKQKANEFKMLYLENLKYKEQMQDLVSKGIISYESEKRIQF